MLLQALRRGADVERVMWWLSEAPLEPLLRQAAAVRDEGHERLVTFSPKVFIPLTQLCRDNCGYCTFAHSPVDGGRAYMTVEEVLAVAQSGADAGCREALFTLGDRPEKRYAQARQELEELGFESTIDYLVHVAGTVLRQTGLLPHMNAGVLTEDELASLRAVSASQGLMLESTSDRLLEPGQAHWGSVDKRPALRLEVLEHASGLSIPFTTGLLVGIGESLTERAQTLVTLAELFRSSENLQELIVQNFRAKPGTLMARQPEPGLEEMLRAIAAARLLLGPRANLQAPPNLQPTDYGLYLDAGINDWGGVSPVTVDHVNPEAPWPELEALAAVTASAGFQLVPRLALYPEYCSSFEARERWLGPELRTAVLRAMDGEGLARAHELWFAGVPAAPPARQYAATGPGLRGDFLAALRKSQAGRLLSLDETEALLRARGAELSALVRAADEMRREAHGDDVTFAVVRNINYTNMCTYHCGFCAFSKGPAHSDMRGPAYRMDIGEIVARAREAHLRGATEVCLQGGIHPEFTGEFYLDVCRAISSAVPQLHIHAFSPLEVWQGASTLGLPLAEYMAQLRDAGLSTLPGTAAEILDDEIRAVICPDKLSTAQWVEVLETAHAAGLRTTSTIMFGSVEGPRHWARHLLVLRDLQRRTAGITEFVPLPFVHMEAPIYRRGQARRGPTWDEAVRLHAAARLALHGHIDNIQASWVKLGLEGALRVLQAGANDLGGTLMNESISRAAGAAHGQEVTSEEMVDAILSVGRRPVQRNTLYGIVRRFDD